MSDNTIKPGAAFQARAKVDFDKLDKTTQETILKDGNLSKQGEIDVIAQGYKDALKTDGTFDLKALAADDLVDLAAPTKEEMDQATMIADSLKEANARPDPTPEDAAMHPDAVLKRFKDDQAAYGKGLKALDALNTQRLQGQVPDEVYKQYEAQVAELGKKTSSDRYGGLETKLAKAIDAELDKAKTPGEQPDRAKLEQYKAFLDQYHDVNKGVRNPDLGYTEKDPLDGGAPTHHAGAEDRLRTYLNSATPAKETPAPAPAAGLEQAKQAALEQSNAIDDPKLKERVKTAIGASNTPAELQANISLALHNVADYGAKDLGTVGQVLTSLGKTKELGGDAIAKYGEAMEAVGKLGGDDNKDARKYLVEGLAEGHNLKGFQGVIANVTAHYGQNLKPDAIDALAKVAAFQGQPELAGALAKCKDIGHGELRKNVVDKLGTSSGPEQFAKDIKDQLHNAAKYTNKDLMAVADVCKTAGAKGEYAGAKVADLGTVLEKIAGVDNQDARKYLMEAVAEGHDLRGAITNELNHEPNNINPARFAALSAVAKYNGNPELAAAIDLLAAYPEAGRGELVKAMRGEDTDTKLKDEFNNHGERKDAVLAFARKLARSGDPGAAKFLQIDNVRAYAASHPENANP
ncbi:MAG: hypothetical protein JWM80_1810 [Cyanobacteria bacterium RYN_339]|nr:hypothetical protein [Cyanobacteria bacterium RYN_339]